jgi:hypothetical protein
MLTVLIVVESPALGVYLESRLGSAYRYAKGRIHVQVVGSAPENSSDLLNEFQNLFEKISSHIAPNWAEGIGSLCVVTDLQGYGPLQWERLNPFAGNGWMTVLGMLILALPEVHWVFAGCSCSDNDTLFRDLSVLDRHGDLAATIELVSRSGLCPLFDPTGIRNRIRVACLGQEMHQLPRRSGEVAAAIDDERDYALLYGFVAYRHGYRCHIVTTSCMMESLFSRSATMPVNFVFEDLFLNFPDKHVPGLSDLRRRDERYPKLANVRRRAIITTGYQQLHEDAGINANLLYLHELRAAGLWNVLMRKPLGGVYSLWQSVGRLGRVEDDSDSNGAPGFARLGESELEGGGRSAGHSTPGRLLQIAKTLLDRAERSPINPESACSAVHRALLATEALELLGGKTPTASLAALAQCHELEALAECKFVGVEGNFDVAMRLEDLQREIKLLARWYKPSERSFLEWNAEAAILQRLIQVFQVHNQFSEENVARIRERELHRRMWFRRHFGEFGDSLRWLNPFYVVSWYVEFLLRSLPGFLVAISVWLSALTVLFTMCGNAPGWRMGFYYALVSFFAMQPPIEGVKGPIVVFAILGGVLHVGVLISHLYSIVSRR